MFAMQFKLFKNIFHNVVILFFMAIIVALYLSPGKDLIADAVVVLAMCLVVLCCHFKGHLRDFLFFIGALVLLILSFLIYRKEFQIAYRLEGVEQVVMGAVVLFLFYKIFRGDVLLNKSYALIFILLIPSLVHLFYLYYDMINALYQWDLGRVDSAGRGFLEYLKDTPRVGRRYASLAMVQLLFVAVMIFLSKKSSLHGKVSIALCGLSVFALLLLDARSAYVSILLAFLMPLVCVPNIRRGFFCQLRGLSVNSKILLTISILMVGLVGFNTGKSRWNALSYSVSVAYADVFNKEEGLKLNDLPYVSSLFWDKPIDDPYRCMAAREFRCVVDQSAYLRSAWLLVGFKSLWERPFGVGYSKDYMARLWELDGEIGVYQRNDSTLVELAVCYGVLGVLAYLAVVIIVLRLIKRGSDAKQPMFSMLLGILILSILCRGFYDLISEGIFKYLMALIGIYFSFIGVKYLAFNHNNRLEITFSKKR